MSESSIKLINKESLLEQRARLLDALGETEGILKALGWEPSSVEVAPVTAVRPRTRLRVKAFAKKKTLREVVLEACWIMRDDITRGGVIDYIQNKYPEMEIKDASIGATLSNLKSDEVIEEVQQGSGGKPSIFRVPDSERSN
jgi:hypothetical protein